MIRKIYAIFDSASRTYSPPFICSADGEAIRAFSDCANSKDHHIGKHPSDYTLMCLGNYNDVTGVIITNEKQENLGVAHTFVVPTLNPAQIDLIERTN